MTLQSYRELEHTREKLRLLEEHYEEMRQKPAENPYLRDLSLQSVRKFMNQLKEEIARFECHATTRDGSE